MCPTHQAEGAEEPPDSVMNQQVEFDIQAFFCQLFSSPTGGVIGHIHPDITVETLVV